MHSSGYTRLEAVSHMFQTSDSEAVSFRTDALSCGYLGGVTIPPRWHHGGSQRPLVVCRKTGMGTYHCPAPEGVAGLVWVGAECERAECIGRLVLEPLQELVET